MKLVPDRACPRDDLFPGRLPMPWTVAAIAPGVGPTGRGFPLPCLPRRSTDIINPTPPGLRPPPPPLEGRGGSHGDTQGKAVPPNTPDCGHPEQEMGPHQLPEPRRYQQEFSAPIGYVSAYGAGPIPTKIPASVRFIPGEWPQRERAGAHIRSDSFQEYSGALPKLQIGHHASCNESPSCPEVSSSIMDRIRR
jgi:hypothetical protein